MAWVCRGVTGILQASKPTVASKFRFRPGEVIMMTATQHVRHIVEVENFTGSALGLERASTTELMIL